MSDSTKQLIILALTVPWEEHLEEANKRKRAKYQELVEEGARLASLLSASGVGLQRIFRAITLPSFHTAGHHWGGKEEGTEDAEKSH